MCYWKYILGFVCLRVGPKPRCQANTRDVNFRRGVLIWEICHPSSSPALFSIKKPSGCGSSGSDASKYIHYIRTGFVCERACFLGPHLCWDVTEVGFPSHASCFFIFRNEEDKQMMVSCSAHTFSLGCVRSACTERKKKTGVVKRKVLSHVRFFHGGQIANKEVDSADGKSEIEREEDLTFAWKSFRESCLTVFFVFAAGF